VTDEGTRAAIPLIACQQFRPFPAPHCPVRLCAAFAPRRTMVTEAALRCEVERSCAPRVKVVVRGA
jgi:hypothetical protein